MKTQKQLFQLILLMIFINYTQTGMSKGIDNKLNSYKDIAKLILKGNLELKNKEQELVKILTSKSSIMNRIAAARGLGYTCSNDKASLEALKKAVFHPNPTLSSQAAIALARLGEPGRIILLEIRKNASSPSRRALAAMALRAKGPEKLERGMVSLATPINKVLYPVWNQKKASIENGSFEYILKGKPLHWKVDFKDDAKGSWVIDRNRYRGGGSSLQINKTNGRGSICISTDSPVTLKKNEKRIFRLFYQAEGGLLENCIKIRLKNKYGMELIPNVKKYHEITYQASLPNTPNDKWWVRLSTYKAPRDMEIYPEIIISGNPIKLWFDDFSATKPYTPAKFVAPLTESLPVLSKSDIAKKLAYRKNSQAKVISKNGRSALIIDGKEVEPIFYVGTIYYNMKNSDFYWFEKYGNVKLQVFQFRINHNKNTVLNETMGIKPSCSFDGTYDFSQAFQTLETIFSKAPNSNVLIAFTIAPSEDIVKEDSSQAWIDHRGWRMAGTKWHLKGFMDPKKQLPKGLIWWPSPFSEKANFLTEKYIKKFVEELRKTPYYKIVVGAVIMGGHDNQFKTMHSDHSESSLNAFRKYLKKHYKTVKELKQAWNDQSVTFNNAKIPIFPNKFYSNESSPMFFDPQSERQKYDYDVFRSLAGFLQVERYAKSFKEAMRKDVITLVYRMGGRGVESRETMDSCYIDGEVPQSSYRHRQPGLYGGLPVQIQDSYGENGKLLVCELDIRSWLTAYHEGFMLCIPTDLNKFKNLLMKETGQYIAKNLAFWYFDIGAPSFRDINIQKVFNKISKVFKKLIDSEKKTFRPDVVLVYSDKPLWARLPNSNINDAPVATAMSGIERTCFSISGVPFDSFYFGDIIKNPKLWDYKVYVFMDCFYLTDKERKFIKNKLKNNNRTLLWLYASGYLNKKGVDVNAISKLIGIKIKTETKRNNATAFAEPSKNILAKGLIGVQGPFENYRVNYIPAPSRVKKIYNPQLFKIVDSKANILAKYKFDNSNAIAVKKLKDWTSVYAGYPGAISTRLFYNIAKNAGAYTLTKPGVGMDMNGNFISLHGIKSGQYELRLPRQCRKVLNPFSEEIIATNTDTVKVNISAGESLWLLLY